MGKEELKMQINIDLLEHGYKVDKPIVYEMEEWLENVTKRKGIKLIKE